MNKMILTGAIGFATGVAAMFGVGQVLKYKRVRETDALLKYYADLVDELQSKYRVWANDDSDADESEYDFYDKFFEDMEREGLNTYEYN